ncbi:MAG: tetratricopeptide repeat protein [Desulfuromonadaceae bacterium]|nr:tetratricopeptide repeat protein [Desulfuromonadaceae bacterium]
MAEMKLKQLRSEWESNPEADTFYLLACAYLEIGLLEAAADILRQGLRHHPGHSRAVATLGQVLFRHKDIDEARATLEQALRFDSTCSIALCTLAEIEIEAGNFQRAEKWLCQAESLGTASHSVSTAALCGTPSAASLRQQLESRRHNCDPDHTDIPFVTETMVELYLKQGMQEKAIAALNQLVIRKPDDIVLRRRLDELRVCEQATVSVSKSFAVQEQLSAWLRAIEYQKQARAGE